MVSNWRTGVNNEAQYGCLCNYGIIKKIFLVCLEHDMKMMNDFLFVARHLVKPSLLGGPSKKHKFWQPSK